jgi:effector-binding domain-containing protein
MPAFEIQERASQPALVIRLHSSIAEIPAMFAVALPEVWHAAEAMGLTPSGPPFGRYLSEFAPELDYEAGVPLPQPAPAAHGRAEPVELPGGTLAVGWHVGPYETLGETYAALMAWIAGQGRTVAGPMWELYWTDPGTEPDASRWRTEVIVPVA